MCQFSELSEGSLSFLTGRLHLNLDPDDVLYTWTYSQWIIEVFKILMGHFYFDHHHQFSGSGNPLTNNMRVKPSHVMLLSQSNLCIPGDEHCGSEHWRMKEWVTDGETSEPETENHNPTWRLINVPQTRLIFDQFEKTLTDGEVVQESSSWNLLGGKQKQKCCFSEIKFFILRCTILKKLFYLFSPFLFLNAAVSLKTEENNIYLQHYICIIKC